MPTIIGFDNKNNKFYIIFLRVRLVAVFWHRATGENRADGLEKAAASHGQVKFPHMTRTFDEEEERTKKKIRIRHFSRSIASQKDTHL